MKAIDLKQVPQGEKNPRSFFELGYKKAFDHKFGDLIPVMMLPVMPDDEINVSFEFLTRFAPFVSQVFQDYTVRFDFYLVPNRLVWRNFELFMSAGYNGKSTYIHPYLDSHAVAHKFDSSRLNFGQSIFDYLDVPPSVFSLDMAYSEHLSALPLAAYLQCYLDYHLGIGTPLNKVQELVMSQEQIVTDGDNTDRLLLLYASLVLNDPNLIWPSSAGDPVHLLCPQKVLYPLDYFTSARPDPQLGPVMTIPVRLVNTDISGSQTFQLVNDASSGQTTDMTGTNKFYVRTQAGEKTLKIHINNPANNPLVVNGSVFNNVATINDFYSAAKLQELLTLYNFSGFTPQQRLSAEFGVKNKDARLHKAEWLHTSFHDVSVGEVFSNNSNVSDSNKDIPGVGTAIATASRSDRGFRVYTTEYGFVVGLMSIFPEAYYSQGLPRHYSIKDRFDYPHYLLSEIGMAAIRQKEIMLNQFVQSSKDDEFAYMSQYGDWKTGINRVCGSLRDSLDYMSAGREFSGQRAVGFNDQFLKVDPSFNNLDRTFNVMSYYPHDCPVLSKVNFLIKAKRQLPYYGLPKF